MQQCANQRLLRLRHQSQGEMPRDQKEQGIQGHPDPGEQKMTRSNADWRQPRQQHPQQQRPEAANEERKEMQMRLLMKQPRVERAVAKIGRTCTEAVGTEAMASEGIKKASVAEAALSEPTHTDESHAG